MLVVNNFSLDHEYDVPGLHVSRIYSPLGASGISAGGINCSNPVPLFSPNRTKRFVIGDVKCDPGRNDSAPLDAVHFSSAIQKPKAEGGSVY